MSKDIDIDDILSEVAKRREENENKVKKEASISVEEIEKPKPEPIVEEIDETEKAKEVADDAENVADETQENADDATSDMTITETDSVVAGSGLAENLADVKEDVTFVEVDAESEVEETPEKIDENADENSEKSAETDNSTEEKADENSDATDEKGEEAENQDEKPNDDTEGVNIMAAAEEGDENLDEDEYPEDLESAKRAKRKRRRKILITIIIILLFLIAAAGVGGAYYINNLLNQVVTDVKNAEVTTKAWAGMSDLVEVFDPIQETEATELASLQDMIKTWYYNGAPVSSTHVLNVLLVGEDTRSDEILEDSTRADSAIIVSVNKDTGEINLTSILRDTYAYWETTPNDESTGTFGKINAAMTSGIDVYINAVEMLYKIDIDNYVIVNFESFETIIDTLGGVTLELTSAEINEINNHPKRYGNVYIEKTFSGSSGEVELTGEQALAYCRIRKIDSDNARADRQKTCLIEIFNQTKDASKTQLLKIITNLLPYVSTGFSKSELVSIATYALSEGWLDFEISTNTLPESRINESGAGGTYYGAWCWKSDFPQDAYNTQLRFYGKSSITLAHIRVDVINCKETGYYSEGSSAVWATITNYNYGETSTLPTTEAEDETESTTIA